MSRDSGRQASAVSRRKYLLTSAAIGTAGLAGCSGSDSGGTGSGSGGDEGSNSIESGSSGPSTVTAEDLDGVPYLEQGSSYWNSNSPASDGEYWELERRVVGRRLGPDRDRPEHRRLLREPLRLRNDR